jgi:ketosteroid isomerase-like protein
MSQENVEVVRRGSAAFNRGDYEGVAESLHPDVEFRDHAHAADAPEALKGRGLSGRCCLNGGRPSTIFGLRSAST